jgi:hypothetical protein
MAAVYKTQGQNAQRLLAMNENLRDKEEVARVEADSLRKARDEIAVLRKKVDQHDELMAEKDRGMQVRSRLDYSCQLPTKSQSLIRRFSTMRSSRLIWS